MSSRFQISLKRRQFLKQLGLAGLASSFPSRLLSAIAGTGSSLSSQAAVKNRAPLAQSAFYPLPLGAIRPTGWLQAQLQIQADGLGGHLDETWPDVGPNSGWLGGSGESWERGPYFLDGLVPLAYLLDDARLKAKAQRYIDWTLNNQAPNGMFGPRSNDDWWPRMVMLKVLTQYHEATGDPRVIPAMQRYFEYQLAALPKRPLRDWGKFRWQDKALSVLWLYNRNGDPKLLDLLRLLHQQGYDWLAEFADFPYTDRITAELIKLNEGEGLKDLALATHGVNNGQAIKTGPVWSLVSGSDTDRDGATRMIDQLDKYHGLPNGMFSCDEHLAGLNPSQGSELCTVVEYHVLARAVACDCWGPGARRPPGTSRLQRPARHIDRRHVGAPVQSGAEPSRVQPASQALDHRRSRVKPFRPRSQLWLLHRKLPSGLAEVCRQPLHALARRWPGRGRLCALRSPHPVRDTPSTWSKRRTIPSAGPSAYE